jgi:hypothetical protein
MFSSSVFRVSDLQDHAAAASPLVILFIANFFHPLLELPGEMPGFAAPGRTRDPSEPNMQSNDEHGNK